MSVVESSGQMSPRSSDISTNSSDSIFFTVLGGREEAGLYGPELCRDPWGSLFGIPFGCCSEPSAPSASRPGDSNGPPVGVNVSSGGRLAGSG